MSPPRSNHVVVVNVHGGFPSSHVSAAIEHLETVRTMRAAGARVCTRVYPTSSCAAGALHDWLMDAPAYTMTDDCWHPWSKSAVAMRSARKARTTSCRLEWSWGKKNGSLCGVASARARAP